MDRGSSSLRYRPANEHFTPKASKKAHMTTIEEEFPNLNSLWYRRGPPYRRHVQSERQQIHAMWSKWAAEH